MAINCLAFYFANVKHDDHIFASLDYLYFPNTWTPFKCLNCAAIWHNVCHYNRTTSQMFRRESVFGEFVQTLIIYDL